ncbi:MAG: anti-sigma factor [Pseudomonadota bacterium]
MNCTESRKLLSALHDGELDQARRTQLEQHLAACADCLAERRSLQHLSGVLGRDFSTQVPEGAAERAFRAAMSAAPIAPSFLESLFPVAWPAALTTTLAAAVLVLWSLSTTPALQFSDADLFDRALGTSSTEQVSGMLQQVLGMDIEAATPRGAG